MPNLAMSWPGSSRPSILRSLDGPGHDNRVIRNPAECFRGVIPENALAFIRDRKKRRPSFVTIPDNAFGVSGMTPADGEAIARIRYDAMGVRFFHPPGKRESVNWDNKNP